jgi:hypothetical protein
MAAVLSSHARWWRVLHLAPLELRPLGIGVCELPMWPTVIPPSNQVAMLPLSEPGSQALSQRRGVPVLWPVYQTLMRP